MKKVLIIGDAESFLINDIVTNIFQHSASIEFDILNTNPSQKVINSSLYKNILKPNKILYFLQLVSSRVNQYLSFFLMRFFIISALNRNRKHYDAIHIHFFNKNLLYVKCSKIIRNTNKLIITIWGSDIYKRNYKQKLKMTSYFNHASAIVFSNPETKFFFLKTFDKFYTKSIVLRTGLGILKNIDNYSQKNISKTELKKMLNIDPQKTIITIGYSSSPDHHTVEIIRLIARNLEPNVQHSIHFIFPLTYGDPRYKKNIISTAQELNLSFTAFESPLPADKIAIIRMATEIMIHLRDTDQFSGSFQEHLYAGNVVITGKWLPYQFLIDQGIYMHCIRSIDDLPFCLNDILSKLNSELSKTIINKNIIAKLSHWNILVDKHLELYL